MITEHITNYDNRDFDKFITVQIYIHGFVFLETEEERNFKMTIPLNEMENYQSGKMNIFKPLIEEKVKRYMISKMKEKCINVVEIARKLEISVKHLLHCYFINNRIDNIDIIWTGSAIKEFKYIPIQHYLEYDDDSVLLKIKGLKFKKKLNE